MITDVFDSTKFSATEHTQDEIQLAQLHATAALYEALLFHDDGGLMLTAPQFFDGISAVNDTWRKLIFKLLKSGHIKIALYNTYDASNPIYNLKDYLSRYVAPKNFNYSSHNEISKLLTQGDTYIKDLNHAVWQHILFGEPAPLLGTDTVSREFQSMIDFFSEFFSDIDNASIYIIKNSNYISYNTFINNSFDTSKINPIVLFNLLGVSERTAYLDFLKQCQNRSEVNTFLAENPFHVQEDIQSDIRKVYEVLYNKFSLTYFDNMEIHVPRIEGKARKSMLEKLVTVSDENNTAGYRYENTEVIRTTAALQSLSIDEVIGMRSEITELQEKDKLPSWNDALQQYRRNLTTVATLHYDETDHDILIPDISTGNTYHFLSQDLHTALQSASKVSIINHIENMLEEDSYIS